MKKLINISKNLRKILDNSNIALINKGLNRVNHLDEITSELNKIEINRLPYALQGELIELNDYDFIGINRIASNAFYYQKSLINVTIPDSVTTIGDSAFQGCDNLIKVTMGNGVAKINNAAFAGCESLTDIYINSTIPPTLYATTVIPKTTTIHVPVGSGDVYKSATNWSSFSARIVEDIQI